MVALALRHPDVVDGDESAPSADRRLDEDVTAERAGQIHLQGAPVAGAAVRVRACKTRGTALYYRSHHVVTQELHVCSIKSATNMREPKISQRHTYILPGVYLTQPHRYVRGSSDIVTPVITCTFAHVQALQSRVRTSDIGIYTHYLCSSFIPALTCMGFT